MRKTLKALATIAALVSVALGLYFAPSALAHNDTHKSYVEFSTVSRSLSNANHSRATKGGSFIDAKSIQSANVESAHQTEVK